MVATNLIFKTSFSIDGDPKCIETWVEMGTIKAMGTIWDEQRHHLILLTCNTSFMYNITMHLTYLSIVSETIMQLTVEFALQQD